VMHTLVGNADVLSGMNWSIPLTVIGQNRSESSTGVPKNERNTSGFVCTYTLNGRSALLGMLFLRPALPSDYASTEWLCSSRS
jgi:hypothetical protein